MTSVYLSHHTARHQRLCHTPISSQVNCSIKSDLFTMMELICGLISALLVWWPSRGPRACSPDDFLATVLYAQPSASTSIYHTQDLGYSQLSSVSSTVTMHMSVIIIHWSVVCVLADEIQQSYIYVYSQLAPKSHHLYTCDKISWTMVWVYFCKIASSRKNQDILQLLLLQNIYIKVIVTW